MPEPKRQRRRITHTTVKVDDRTFALIFTPDGLKLRERCQRDERLVTYDKLVRHHGLTATSFNVKAAEELDVTAEDLKILASAIEAGDKPNC